MMLRKLESLACFLAALMALTVEACFVYYIRTLPWGNVSSAQFPSSWEWMSPRLPQCWMAGALVALFYYLVSAQHAEPQRASQARRTFLRTWYWFLALASAQGCVLYVGHLALVQR